MIIERKSQKSILPEAVDVLGANSIITYHTEYNKRHPLGVYNISMQKVWKYFVEVLDAIDHLQETQSFRDDKQYGTRFDEPVVDAQEHLLLTIKEHFDDCLSVLKCFYPYSVGGKRKQFDAEQPIIDYKNSIGEFFEHVSQIANHIKHHQGRPILLVMFNDDYSIPGYFLQTINDAGEIVPYRKIHKPIISELDSQSGCDTAFSFSRDLRYLFWGIYFTSHHLADAINSITNSTHAAQYPDAGKMDEMVLSIAQRISNLPKRFFEDELKKHTPSIQVIEIENETRLRIAYPSNQLLIASNGKHKSLVPFVSDGVSTTYRLPYWKGKL